MADTNEKEKPEPTSIEDDEFEDYDEPQRHRQRVDPDEAEDFDEWRSERRQKGRKRRRHGEDRRRQRDEWDEG